VMKRYTIMVQEYGSNREVELCGVDSNPQAVVDGLRKKTLTVNLSSVYKRTKIPKYTQVRVIQNRREEHA